MSNSKDIEKKLKACRNNEKRWAIMLVYADALEEEGIDGRGWRWIAQYKQAPLKETNRPIYWFMYDESIVNAINNICKTPRQSIKYWYIMKQTRFEAEQALAEWIIQQIPLPKTETIYHASYTSNSTNS